MKCYLHIGTEKSATTVLQNFLHLNRSVLKNYGYLYTERAGAINNQKLAVAAYNIDERDDLTNIYNIHTNKDLSKFQQKTINELKHEVKSGSQPNIIFSSEHIQSRLTNIKEIKRLKEILIELGADDIIVIVYLRNPSDIANSLFSTAIKSGHTISVPPSPKNKYFNNVCNHKNTLDKFGSVFGERSLRPRIYDKKEFKNGSIIRDFIDITGIPWHNDYNIPKNLNESLSLLGIEILKRFNNKVPSFINNNINPLRDDIIKYFDHHFTGDKYIMPKQLYIEYDKAFKESNEWVREKWFPERSSLFQKNEYLDKPRLQINGVELDQIANMLAEIWIDKQSRFNSSFDKRS